jgi:hypothetical protein
MAARFATRVPPAAPPFFPEIRVVPRGTTREASRGDANGGGASMARAVCYAIAMVRPPARPVCNLTPSEKEQAIEEMVRNFADALDIGPEKARRVLAKVFGMIAESGITLDQAIDAISEDPSALN